MEKLKFGLIGCGRIAQRHAQWAAQFGELVAVCDIIPDRAEKLAQQYSSKAYSKLEDMLESEKSIDVISICTPNGLHAAHSIKALKSGFHVLCEKPMAIQVHDCVEMIKTAETANKRLFIVKQNRYNPPVEALKKAIDEGKLGQILSIQLNCYWNRGPAYFQDDWKGTRKLDGGTLYTQFSHFIDLLYWMIGDIKNVKSYINNRIHQDTVEFEDEGVAIVEFYNGVIGTINFSINAFKKNMEGSLTVFGEKGTVKVGGQYLNELEYQEIENYRIEGLPEGNPPNNYGNYVGSMSNHDKVYQNVRDVLLNGGVIGTVGIEGLKTVEIIDKIYRAAQNG